MPEQWMSNMLWKPTSARHTWLLSAEPKRHVSPRDPHRVFGQAAVMTLLFEFVT